MNELEGAKLIQVIVERHCIGTGNYNNPFRIVTNYYSTEGKLLASRDLWKEGKGFNENQSQAS